MDFDELIGLLVVGVAVVAWLAVADNPSVKNLRRAIMATLAIL